MNIGDYKILVVEDSEEFSRMLKVYLNRMGFSQVTTAIDAESALVLLGRKKFDLIVSDFNMGEMDGVDFFHAVQNDPLLKNIPFIMISSEVRRENVDKISRSGIKNYLLLYLDTVGVNEWLGKKVYGLLKIPDAR